MLRQSALRKTSTGKYDERENVKYLSLEFTKCGHFGGLSGDLGVTSRLLPTEHLLYLVLSLKNPQFITSLALAHHPTPAAFNHFPCTKADHWNDKAEMNHRGWGWGTCDPIVWYKIQEICNLNKFPGGAEAAFWGPHFENHCCRSWENTAQFNLPHHFLLLCHPLDP